MTISVSSGERDGSGSTAEPDASRAPRLSEHDRSLRTVVDEASRGEKPPVGAASVQRDPPGWPPGAARLDNLLGIQITNVVLPHSLSFVSVTNTSLTHGTATLLSPHSFL